ncbi:uncharacterized protein LOC133668700 [Populus nigra]|uniref:uncharacterized protein LOC133668700 n=1 Tax=Populus nigra TaxID=3691 RepID=UPI002B27BF9A|nr:uncharacterized protein LOC133668700 [Populus nigra]
MSVFIAFHIIRVLVYNLLCFRLSNQTQGRILTFGGVTAAICSAAVAAFSNLVAIAGWPTWVAVAICETVRKVVTYVVTRPGRELLFTVVTQEEKYKAKLLQKLVAFMKWCLECLPRLEEDQRNLPNHLQIHHH